jgi:hypothetical protein
VRGDIVLHVRFYTATSSCCQWLRLNLCMPGMSWRLPTGGRAGVPAVLVCMMVRTSCAGRLAEQRRLLGKSVSRCPKTPLHTYSSGHIVTCCVTAVRCVTVQGAGGGGGCRGGARQVPLYPTAQPQQRSHCNILHDNCNNNMCVFFCRALEQEEAAEEERARVAALAAKRQALEAKLVRKCINVIERGLACLRYPACCTCCCLVLCLCCRNVCKLFVTHSGMHWRRNG